MSEKKKKVFISGPMSGIKDFNKPAFDKAEQQLTQAGYSVFNPARMHFDDAWSHEEIMRIDLAALAQCDYILMLDEWDNSTGATQERSYANAIGVEVLTAHNAEYPKKEEKPSQRIEIETFGDISEENINMLMLVERHYSELLATGGTITKVEITCEPKPAPKKSCNTCKYVKYKMLEEPCTSCTMPFAGGNHTNWEPKDAEK